MKKRIVYIAPHLSTGGMPQYLYKQMELLNDEFELYCIEWDNVTGGILVVQRNRILNLIGDRLITLGSDRTHLFTLLEQIKPEVVHLQEIPEMFMPYDIAKRLYQKGRQYSIIETSHDSSYNVDNKIHFPDNFLMVSQYQIEQYKKLGIPCDLVEYPIEYNERKKSREQILSELGLDPNVKHIINVGLFTPRKNQAEVIEYAKMMQGYPVQFHFLGNHADNFKFYWEPIMRDFPSNCKWWNERTDVDNFYQIADLFLFTSRGSDTDKETMPLVIREALSWKTPSLIYNLPVYLGYFDKFPTIEYLDFNSLERNKELILQKLGITERITTPATYTVPKIWSRWNESERKMHFGCDTTIPYPVIITIREYKSDGILWSTTYDSLYGGLEYWIVPSPYQMDKYAGVKICIYRKDTEEQIYEHPYFLKFVNIPTVTLSNTVPYYLNYTEYWVDKKYDRFFADKYDNIVDAGANIGVFAKYMLHQHKTKKLVLIECDPTNIRDLERNFRSDDRVTIIDKAISHSKEPITFYRCESNSVISSTLPPEEIAFHGAGTVDTVKTTVDTITIADLVNQLGTIDLLKIDIEGGEYDLIDKLDERLFARINNLFIECHYFQNDYVEKWNRLTKKLVDNGYSIEEYPHDKLSMKGNSECIYASKHK
jgi:FkbM family methyltransferase